MSVKSLKKLSAVLGKCFVRLEGTFTKFAMRLTGYRELRSCEKYCNRPFKLPFQDLPELFGNKFIVNCLILL